MKKQKKEFSLPENNNEVKYNAVIQKYLSLFYKDDIFKFYDWIIDDEEAFEDIRKNSLDKVYTCSDGKSLSIKEIYEMIEEQKKDFKILKQNILYHIKQRRKNNEKRQEKTKKTDEKNSKDTDEEERQNFLKEFDDVDEKAKEFLTKFVDDFKDVERKNKYSFYNPIANIMVDINKKYIFKPDNINDVFKKIENIIKNNKKKLKDIIERKENIYIGPYSVENQDDKKKQNKNNFFDDIYNKLDKKNQLDEKEKQLFEYIIAIYKNEILDNGERKNIFEKIKEDIEQKLNITNPYLPFYKLEALSLTNVIGAVGYKNKTADFIKNNVKEIGDLNFLKQEEYKQNKIMHIIEGKCIDFSEMKNFQFKREITKNDFLKIKKNIIDFLKIHKIYNDEIESKINNEIFSDDTIEKIEELNRKLKEINKDLQDGVPPEPFIYDEIDSQQKKIFDKIQNGLSEIEKDYIKQKKEEIEGIVKQIGNDKEKLKQYAIQLDKRNEKLLKKNNVDIKIVDNDKYQEKSFEEEEDDLKTVLNRYSIVIYNGNFRPNTILKPCTMADSHNIFMMLDDGNVVKFPDNDEGKERTYINLFDLDESLAPDIKEMTQYIVEENVMQDKNNDFQRAPYKFYCSGGKVFVCRAALGKTLGVQYFLDENFKESEKVKDEKKVKEQIKENINDKVEEITKDKLNILNGALCSKESYQKMWNIASKIGKKFPTIRVDLFCVKQKDGQEKIFLNELEDNGGSNYRIFQEYLKPKYAEKYYDMISYDNVDEQYLLNEGKQLKNLHFKIGKKECKEVNLEIQGGQQKIANESKYDKHEEEDKKTKQEKINKYEDKKDSQEDLIKIIPYSNEENKKSEKSSSKSEPQEITNEIQNRPQENGFIRVGRGIGNFFKKLFCCGCCGKDSVNTID